MAKFMMIGPLSRDRIVKKDTVFNSIGGAVYYQSAVFSAFGVNNTVVTTLAESDKDLLQEFHEITRVVPVYTDQTMEFENIYPDDDPNHRIQRSNIPSNPILPTDFRDIKWETYNALLLSPLSPYDLPFKTIKYLSKQNVPIYLGAQGYLRYKEDDSLVLKPWKESKKYLKHVRILFLDEVEARVILGKTAESCTEIAHTLSIFGPEEVIITRGDQGALIYSKRHDEYFNIPIFPPEKTVDPTGLGDTFMAAYTLKKMETDNPERCGKFASKIASLKMEHRGAFKK